MRLQSSIKHIFSNLNFHDIFDRNYKFKIINSLTSAFILFNLPVMIKEYIIILAGIYTAFSCANITKDKQKTGKESDNPKPNIIFIMADDLGYGDLECYGQRKIKTPNIDSLAAQGMLFTQCYAGSSVCAPSRNVLMTGMHTGHVTVRGNLGKGGVKGLGGGEGRVPLSAGDTTIAQVLRKAGYVTAMVGKWGLGEPHTTGEPNKKGFDEFYGFLNQRRAHTYYPDYIWKDTTKVVLTGNEDGQRKEYTHELFVNYILDFLNRNQNKPFFLYVPFCIPHAAYEVPDYGIYEDEHWTDIEKAYAAMITRMDASVGRIMKKLKELNIDDNTWVFFTSDNGPSAEDDSLKMFDSGGPFRGAKRDPYEGGIRVPMIVRCPREIAPGQTNDFVWYFADVMPTLASIAHTRAPENIDGINVLPVLQGKKQDTIQRYLYWEFYERTGWRALRYGDWKAVQQDMYYKEPRAIELYNLKDDISESHNIADQHPEIIMKVKELFREAHRPSPNFMWKPAAKSANTL